MDRTLAFVLAGGAGSRLGALTAYRAKPAVPFAGRGRLIDFTLRNAASSGVRRLGVVVQYRAESVVRHLRSGKAGGYDDDSSSRALTILSPRLTTGSREQYRGTADAIRKNLDFIESHPACDTVLILSGDHVYRMNYAAMVEQHRRRQADLTIATTRVPAHEAHRFGIAGLDSAGRIVEWHEKPLQPRGVCASMGIYAFSRKFLLALLRELPGDDFGHDFIPIAVAHARTYAHEFSGYWRDVGTVKSYWQTALDLLGPARELCQAEQSSPPAGLVSRHAFVAASARIENSLISAGCIVEGVVRNSVLSPGVWVRENAVVLDSVVLDGCEIGCETIVKKAVLDEQVRLGRRSILGLEVGERAPSGASVCHDEGVTVVASHVVIPAFQMVPCNSMVTSESTLEFRPLGVAGARSNGTRAGRHRMAGPEAVVLSLG